MSLSMWQHKKKSFHFININPNYKSTDIQDVKDRNRELERERKSSIILNIFLLILSIVYADKEK